MTRLAPVSPVLRAALALVWFAGEAVPLFVLASATNMARLARVGLSGGAATTALWAGALADIAVVAALLLRIRGATFAGIGLMATYTLILTAIVPRAVGRSLRPARQESRRRGPVARRPCAGNPSWLIICCCPSDTSY
jgi:hypothetical protein